MSRKVGVRIALLTGLVTIGLSTTAIAQTATPATGLGQSWPNATDVSQNPNFHVYVFKLNGVKYVQINDLNGVVHAAVGVVSGTAFALPIGADSQNVTTSSTSTSTTGSSASPSTATTVYSDSDTTVNTTTTSAGTLQVQALEDCTSFKCGGSGSP